MRIFNPPDDALAIYQMADAAMERIVMWKGTDGNWWVVARVAPDGDSDYGALEVAFTLDGNGDTTVQRWADRTLARARHPEREPAR